MSDIVERLRDRKYFGQEYMRREAADEIQSLRQRVERLEGALRPFARIEVIEPSGNIVGLERYDFERARAALSPKVQEGE